MANTKVTQHVIADDAITTSMITDGNVTVAKLPSTVDLSSKTLTLPAITIPSASTATTQSQSDGSTKVATTAYVDTAITNLIDSAPGTLNTLNELAAALNDDASFNTTISNSVAAKLPLAGGTMTGDLILGDNVKLELGAASGGDLQIYHDGSNSYIKDDGTGNLFIQGGPAVVIEDTGGNNMAYFGDGGEVILYHNHTAKFETTAYGASTSGTGAFKLPVGTTGQRPTAATGQLRFNSTDGKLEVYTGSAWSAVGSGGVGNHNLDTFTGDGSTTAFTLTVTPSDEDSLTVFIDGAYQEKGDYSLSGTTLTLDTAPLSGEKISVHTITGTIHDGTAALNQQFTGDGSTTAFTLNAAPGSENNTQVFINGVYQQKTDYTVSGTTLTFDTAPTNGDIIEVNSFTVTNLGSSDQVPEGSSNLYHTSARAISAISSGNLTGLTVDTNTLSVDATNNRVGINTTSPTRTLSVEDTSSAAAIEIKNNSGQHALFNYYGTGHLDIGNSASNGNVTIYTNNGNANLIMNENGNLYLTGGNDRRIKLSDSGIAGESDSNNTVHIRGDNDFMKLNAAGNGGFIFEEDGTERMRIDSTGALLVGTTSQIVSSVEECVHIKNGDGAGQLFLDNTRSSGNQYMVQIYRLGTRVGSIQTSTTGTSYLETSDYRLKENVDYEFNALERVAQLKPARFNFIKEPDVTVDGFLAHEVAPVVPQAVSGEKDAVDEEGNPDLQGIDHSKLVPLLTKAIQELKTENDNLKARIETLEG